MQNINLRLGDELGKILEESGINFAPVVGSLRKGDDYQNKYPFLSGIDPYGLTYFNVHQTPYVIKELQMFKDEDVASQVQNEILGTIEFLNKVYQHVYIEFIGD